MVELFALNSNQRVEFGVHGFELRIDADEALVDAAEPLVDTPEPLVDAPEPLVDTRESSVHMLAQGTKSTVHLFLQSSDGHTSAADHSIVGLAIAMPCL